MCRELIPAPTGKHLCPALMGCPVPWAGAGVMGMAECTGAEPPPPPPPPPGASLPLPLLPQQDAGLAARAVGELGQARLCLSSCQSASILWPCLCPGNRS